MMAVSIAICHIYVLCVAEVFLNRRWPFTGGARLRFRPNLPSKLMVCLPWDAGKLAGIKIVPNNATPVPQPTLKSAPAPSSRERRVQLDR
jgi:hypothetical protein